MADKLWTGATSGDWNVAGNWSPSGVPGASDDVYFRDNAVDVDTNLDQSAGVLHNSLNIDQSYTGKIGTFATGVHTYLIIKATTVNIGEHYGLGSPAGSGRLLIDTTTTASQINVYNSATTSTEANKMPIRLLANSTSTDIHIQKGNVSIANQSAETATIGDLNIGYLTNQASDANVIIGTGLTLTNFNMNGGTVTLRTIPTNLDIGAGTLDIINNGGSGVASFDLHGGTINAFGTCALGAIDVYGGTAFINTTGTVSVDIRGGVVDLTQVGLLRSLTPNLRQGTYRFQADQAQTNVDVSGQSVQLVATTI